MARINSTLSFLVGVISMVGMICETALDPDVPESIYSTPISATPASGLSFLLPKEYVEVFMGNWKNEPKSKFFFPYPPTIVPAVLETLRKGQQLPVEDALIHLSSCMELSSIFSDTKSIMESIALSTTQTLAPLISGKDLYNDDEPLDRILYPIVDQVKMLTTAYHNYVLCLSTVALALPDYVGHSSNSEPSLLEKQLMKKFEMFIDPHPWWVAGQTGVSIRMMVDMLSWSLVFHNQPGDMLYDDSHLHPMLIYAIKSVMWFVNIFEFTSSNTNRMTPIPESYRWNIPIPSNSYFDDMEYRKTFNPRYPIALSSEISLDPLMMKARQQIVDLSDKLGLKLVWHQTAFRHDPVNIVEVSSPSKSYSDDELYSDSEQSSRNHALRRVLAAFTTIGNGAVVLRDRVAQFFT